MIRIESIADAEQVIRFKMAREVVGRPYYLTAAYWVDGLLIDTGCAHTAPQLTSALKSLHVNQAANTHSHEDHIGANAGVQELFGCPILAHPEALPILENPKLQPLQPYRRVFWGWPQPSQGTAIGEWVETERYRFQVVHTPGHSPDHICFFEPEQGWLFSGDAYIGGQDRALREGYDIHGIIASLKKTIRTAGQDDLFRQRHGAHGRQAAPGGKDRVPGRAGRKDPVAAQRWTLSPPHPEPRVGPRATDHLFHPRPLSLGCAWSSPIWLDSNRLSRYRRNRTRTGNRNLTRRRKRAPPKRTRALTSDVVTLRQLGSGEILDKQATLLYTWRQIAYSSLCSAGLVR